MATGYNNEVKKVKRQLTQREAIDRLSEIFPQWKNVPEDQVLIKNISIGLSNTLWQVEKTDSTADEKFVFRFYGGNLGISSREEKEDIKPDSSLELENAVAKAASEMNIGPKTYWFEREFRIEQFIESRNFNLDDYADPSMLKEFARNLARFHCISERPEMEKFKDMPINTFERGRVHFNNSRDNWNAIFKLAHEKYNFPHSDANILLDKINLMESISKQLKLKKGMINNDLNLSNILVRQVTQPGQLKTVLIDYENAQYNLRCFDIGFLSSANGLTAFRKKGQHTFSHEEINGVLDYYEDSFLRAYLDEYIDFNKDNIDASLDNWDNFHVEARFGICFTHYYITLVRCYFYFLAVTDKFDESVDMFAKRMQADFIFAECAEKRLKDITTNYDLPL